MTREETLYTRYGEMLDFIAIMQIESGALIPVQDAGMTYDEVMRMD